MKEMNVFISHVHEDDDGLQKLKDLLKPKGMNVRDYSITSDKFNRAKSEDYIKNEILGPRIDQCSTLVVYITPQTKDSKYVNWEIERAEKSEKRIVGVWAYGEKGCAVPDALHAYADAVVGWTGDSIVDAINGKKSGWEDPDGQKIDSRNIARYSCA